MTPIPFARRQRSAVSLASIGLILAGCGGASDLPDLATATQIKSVDTRTSGADTTPATSNTTTTTNSVKQVANSLATRAGDATTTPVTKSTGTTAPSASGTSTSTAPISPAVTPVAADTSGALASLPLVQQGNLRYVGAFRFPATQGKDACDGFAYGGTALTFNPAGNGGAGSLLASGHNYCGRVGEFTIPSITQAASSDGLAKARLLQPATQGELVDSLEGRLTSSGITGGTHNTVNGLLVYNNRLAISGGNNYTYSQPVSHWSRPLDLSIRGQVTAATTVSGDGGYSAARLTAGYMCHVPTTLQAALGGPALTGWVADSIVSASSNGPAAFAFDPNRLAASAGGTVSARTLLYYPVSNPLQESVSGETQQVWNWTSMPRGCAVPNGTRTVLFLGRHGTGEFRYGVGGPNGHTNTGGYAPIYDPSDNSTGEHAWPYRYQVWAYDANDMNKVARGQLKPYQVRPYATWRIDLPFSNPAGSHGLGGVAYDPKTRRLFVVQDFGAAFGEPVIHTFLVDNAVSTNVTY